MLGKRGDHWGEDGGGRDAQLGHGHSGQHGWWPSQLRCTTLVKSRHCTVGELRKGNQENRTTTRKETHCRKTDWRGRAPTTLVVISGDQIPVTDREEIRADRGRGLYLVVVIRVGILFGRSTWWITLTGRERH